MIVQAHREMTCHCGAAKTLQPVYLGGGIALFYCESCARGFVEDMVGRAGKESSERDAWKPPLRCVCGSKFPTMTVSLRVGALFSLCDRCADDLAHEFRKALKP